MFEIIFLSTAAVGLTGMVVIAWRKLPVLVKLPETAALQINAKEVVLDFIKKIKNSTPLKNLSGKMFLHKVLSKTRVLAMKTDNKTFHWLQKLRENPRQSKFSRNDNYWKEIRNSTGQENNQPIKKKRSKTKPA